MRGLLHTAARNGTALTGDGIGEFRPGGCEDGEVEVER